jgi:hypothetical protein
MGHANFYVLITDWLTEMNWQTIQSLMFPRNGAQYVQFECFDDKGILSLWGQSFVLSV